MNQINKNTLERINPNLAKGYCFARSCFDQKFIDINTWINYKSWSNPDGFFFDCDKNVFWYPF